MNSVLFRVVTAAVLAVMLSAPTAVSGSFYGADCSVKLPTLKQWNARLVAGIDRKEKCIVSVGRALDATVLPGVVRAQAVNARRARRLEDVNVPPAELALWAQLEACANQHIQARGTSRFRADRVTFLATERWMFEMASGPQTLMNAGAYNKVQWQKSYADPNAGTAAVMRRCGPGAVPAATCQTTGCTDDKKEPNCASHGHQVLTEWIAKPGMRLRGFVSPVGTYRMGMLWDTAEADLRALTMKVAPAATLAPATHVGLPVDFVKWEETGCTFTKSRSQSKVMFTSLVNGCYVFIASNPLTGQLLMIHANANKIGDRTPANELAKYECAEQIMALNPGFVKHQKFTEAEYITLNSLKISAYAVRAPGGGHNWSFGSTRIAGDKKRTLTRPGFVPWV